MKMKISILPGSRTHYSNILKIYNEGFLPKFRFVTRNKEHQLSFIDDFGLINIETGDKEFVAISDGKVVGILSLRYFHQDKDKHSPNLPLRTLVLKYGLLSLLKALFLELSFKYHPPKNELYIDSISVAADARSQGVGSLLLSFTESFAREKGLRVVSLNVMFENTQAKSLYEKKGYRVKSSQSFWWLKKTTGYSGAYFMVKDI